MWMRFVQYVDSDCRTGESISCDRGVCIDHVSQLDHCPPMLREKVHRQTNMRWCVSVGSISLVFCSSLGPQLSCVCIGSRLSPTNGLSILAYIMYRLWPNCDNTVKEMFMACDRMFLCSIGQMRTSRLDLKVVGIVVKRTVNMTELQRNSRSRISQRKERKIEHRENFFEGTNTWQKGTLIPREKVFSQIIYSWQFSGR